jgi:hypothetical protein
MCVPQGLACDVVVGGRWWVKVRVACWACGQGLCEELLRCVGARMRRRRQGTRGGVEWETAGASTMAALLSAIEGGRGEAGGGERDVRSREGEAASGWGERERERRAANARRTASE